MTYQPTASQLAFLTLPGSTGIINSFNYQVEIYFSFTVGHIATIIMVFMYTSAIYYIRSPMFNVFWFTHHLFILYYAILSFHGNFLL